MKAVSTLALVVIAIALGAIAVRQWDPPKDTTTPAIVTQLRYGNCLARAAVLGSPNPVSRDQEIEANIVDGPLQNEVGRRCKAP